MHPQSGTRSARIISSCLNKFNVLLLNGSSTTTLIAPQVGYAREQDSRLTQTSDLYYIRQCSDVLDFWDCTIPVKREIYRAITRTATKYECASTVWDSVSQKHTQLLEQIQRRAAEWVFNNYSDRTTGEHNSRFPQTSDLYMYHIRQCSDIFNFRDCTIPVKREIYRAIARLAMKNSEYDQEIPQSQTADNPVASRGRAAQPSRDTRKTN